MHWPNTRGGVGMNEHTGESHDPIESRVRGWYAAQEPSASLRAMAETVRAGREEALVARDPNPTQRAMRGGAIGAVAAAVVIVAAFIWSGAREQSHTRAIAAEIALNHEKHLDPDVLFDRYEQAATLLPKLGFTPSEPLHAALDGLTLAGGRYCSIHGDMAVQFRLYDEQGGAYTLYQFRPDRGERRIDAVVEAEGVRVRLWSDGELMFGLAEDAR